MTYYLAFDNGFRLWYGDSAGPATAAERQLAQQISRIDVGLIPYYGGELERSSSAKPSNRRRA